MQIISDIYSATGKSTPTHWGQIIDFSTVFGVIEVTSDTDSARDIGVRFVSELSRVAERYMPISQLKQQILPVVPKALTSLILLVPRGNSVELLLFGTGSIYMRRKTTFALLTSIPGTMTGEVVPHDTILLLNASAGVRCGTSVSRILSPHLSAKEIAEALAIQFSEAGESQSRAEAGLIFAVSDVVSETSHSVVLPPSKPYRIYHRRPDIHKIAVKIKTIVRSRPYVLLSIFIGGFFAVSVFFGIQRQANDRQYKEMNAAYQDANALFNQALAVMTADSNKSLDLLKQADARLASLPLSTLPPGKEARSVTDLSAKIADNLAIVSRVNKRDVQLFYDADFLQKGRSITAMTVRNGNIFILDSDAGMLAVVAIANKKAEILEGGNAFVGATTIASSPKALYVATDEGIRAVRPGESDSEVVIPKDQIEGSVDSIATFGENVYTLNKGTGKVWRYIAEDSGFGKAQNFFAEDVLPDLSKTTNIVIDGSVWLGSQTGKVFRYTQGRDDPFLIRNVDPPLGQTVYVTKEDTGGTVYVLDPDNNRVVLLSETGGYLSQYQWSQNLKPSAIAVSDSQKQVYLLADKKIYALTVQ